ncbi:MAG TPA: serine hydrolase [Candidatus Eisenbacteria bacterium]|nr:serine hydrolase [Candidatus Eisenbacteria bacterium]
MSVRGLRAFGALMLIALTASPIVPAEAAAASGRGSKTTLHAASSKSVKRSHRARRRGVRRMPPGGVVWARNAIVLDPTTGAVLYEKNAGASAPIASLTKLMTALVLLEQSPDFERIVTVSDRELSGGGHTQLKRGEQVRMRDLLHMSLMCSDNVATRVLVRESGLDGDNFLARMNRKAVELGLARTRFVEFTGLDERNVSTAADIARLLRAAAENPTIHEISTMRGHDFIGLTARSRPRPHHVSNTNRLLYGRYDIQAGKTGFINEAGYCFATWIRTDRRDMIAVVLGAPTNATRFADVVRLVQHTTSLPAGTSGL